MNWGLIMGSWYAPAISRRGPRWRAWPFCLPHFGVVLLAALFCSVAFHSLAHEGHDLQPAETATMLPSLPRLVTNSEAYELVGILDSGHLTIYLDRFEDNSPVIDANIMVTINDESVVAQSAADGTYFVTSKRFDRGGGLFELLFDISAREGDDLLIGKLSLAT